MLNELMNVLSELFSLLGELGAVLLLLTLLGLGTYTLVKIVSSFKKQKK